MPSSRNRLPSEHPSTLEDAEGSSDGIRGPTAPDRDGDDFRQTYRPFRMEDPGETTISMQKDRERKREENRIVLRVVAGRDLLKFIELTPGSQVLIGRDEVDCRLHLTDASVSRRHARVTVDPDGAIHVQDLGSTNGTAINGRQTDRGFLHAGAALEVGAVGMRLESLTTKELNHLQEVLLALESANRDPLTGLTTRAWLDDELPEVLERADATNSPVAGVLIDVDHFKSINDRFGHTTGDEVLRCVARIVLYTIRDSDAAIRYGGEEIMLVLPTANDRGATDAADRIRRDIRSHDWARTAVGLTVTASAGVAERRHKESALQWIERMDQALYAAKRGGRNQVISAGS